MSLVTRCTSCGTLFRVVADQLKISDGWVRCGQCATVFDAQANLVETATSTPVAASQLPQENVASSVAQSSPDSSSPASAAAPDSIPSIPNDIASEIQSFRESKLQEGATLGAFAYAPVSQSASPASLSDEEPLNIASRSEEPTTFIPESKLDSAILSESGSEPSDVTPLNQSSATPGFVKQAQRAQRWRSPWVRAGLSVICLILMLVLALQIALHNKDHIAAQWPQTKPWLEKLCQQADCQVQPLKRIETITVDASSFNRINKNNVQLEAITQSYRLGVTLKNTGKLAVALPHVELSLQDAQDQPILRRVLSPADLGSSLIELAPAQEMAGSVTLQIDTAQLAGSKIQGYRVLAFYP